MLGILLYSFACYSIYLYMLNRFTNVYMNLPLMDFFGFKHHLRSKCWQRCFLQRLSSLPCRWLTSCVFTRSLLCLCTWLLPTFFLKGHQPFGIRAYPNELISSYLPFLLLKWALLEVFEGHCYWWRESQRSRSTVRVGRRHNR